MQTIPHREALQATPPALKRTNGTSPVSLNMARQHLTVNALHTPSSISLAKSLHTEGTAMHFSAMFLLSTAITVWLTASAIDAAAVRTSSPLVTASSSGIPAPPQNTSSIPALVETAYTFLKSHLCTGRRWGYNYHFYRPSLQKYSADQWLWDSGSHQIVWSHRNASNAVLSLRSLLHLQAVDGRVPEMVGRGTWYCLYGIALHRRAGISTPHPSMANLLH